MGDAIKIAVKTGLIVIIMTAIVVLFSVVQIPAVDFSVLTQGLGVALATLYHWVPIMRVLFPVLVVILGVDLALIVFNFGMIAVRWVMKVNE